MWRWKSVISTRRWRSTAPFWSSSCEAGATPWPSSIWAINSWPCQRVDDRHFGLVVEDKAAVAGILEEMGVEIISERFLDFLDPWGNRIEIVGYENIQFTKVAHVLRGMGLGYLEKSESALKELAEKGMAPD
jgi:hypothetical protein